MRRPIHHADRERHTKHHTSSCNMVNAPAASAIAAVSARDGCQCAPMTIPVSSIAKLQKNITAGLPRRTLSFSFILNSPYFAAAVLGTAARSKSGCRIDDQDCSSLSTKTIAASCHAAISPTPRSEEHTSELQSLRHLVCRLLL